MTDNIASLDYYDTFMEWAKSSGLRVKYFYEIKANVRREQVAQLCDAGFTIVQPGIESFSSNLLALMRKGITGIQNIAFLKYARDYGLWSVYNLLIGFPDEDPEEHHRTAVQLPKLAHLQPPTVVRVAFHRFSPYHDDPASFGIRLKPDPAYRAIYPFSDDEIARIAYVFVRDDEHPEPLYMQELEEGVAAWRETFKHDDCSLTFREEAEQGTVLIRDRRPEFPRRDYRLHDFAAVLFHSVDSPRKLQAIVKEAQSCADVRPSSPIVSIGAVLFSFSREEFLRDPHACLAPLVENGIIYVEGDRLLALPVTEHYRPLGLGSLISGKPTYDSAQVSGAP
jgi:hypothetical protein